MDKRGTQWISGLPVDGRHYFPDCYPGAGLVAHLLAALVMKLLMDGLLSSVNTAGGVPFTKHPPGPELVIPICVYLPPLSPSPLSPALSDARAENRGPPLSPWQVVLLFFPPAATMSGGTYSA